MTTKKQLEKAYDKAAENLKPFTEIFEQQKKEYDNKVSECEKPFLALLDTYYDEQLILSNNEPVRKGMVITKGKSKYLVFDRGMQFLFGTMMFNPRIMCKRMQEDGQPSPNGKTIHIFPSELKEYSKL